MMTNVPDEVRNALADAYKLFDVSYKMTGTIDDWQKYWEKGNELIQKYGDDIPLLEIVTAYAGIIQTVVLKQEKQNKSLVWEAGRDYPYPKVGNEI